VLHVFIIRKKKYILIRNWLREWGMQQLLKNKKVCLGWFVMKFEKKVKYMLFSYLLSVVGTYRMMCNYNNKEEKYILIRNWLR